MSDLAVEATGLVKTYGDNRAVDGVDLSVATGTVYAVLGPNGSGKTTTIRMLATLIRPDAGSARVLGYDLARDADQVRSRISLTGQLASVDEELTGSENLVMLARLYGLSRRRARQRAGQLLDAFGLAAVSGRLARAYSGGMRRRLDIAASLIVTPDLLFLDEPTTGLDPHSRGQVWEAVRSLAANGTTVLMTTQYLDEADQLADRIVVLDLGRVIAEGTPADLKASVGSGVLRVRLRDAAQRQAAAQVLSGQLATAVQLEPEPVALSLRVPDGEPVPHALAALGRAGIPVTDFALGQPSLDEVFLALTGHTTGKSAPHDARSS